MRYIYLNSYTDEELEDLIDTLSMNICRGMFQNNKDYYKRLDEERNRAIEILRNRRRWSFLNVRL